MSTEARVAIATDADMVPARAKGREVASQLGFSRTDGTLIATAISEVARNILVHAGSGEIVIEPLYEDDRRGIRVAARDRGPGIRDVDAALRDGYASGGGLGLGLPGAKRLMDELQVESEPGHGTTVTMVKWRELEELERLPAKRSDA
jgi:anti-sigma regulatory factor (Ser/Thr protein kinase)